MAIYHNDIVNINLESGSLHRSFMNHSIGSADSNANRFGIRVFRDGEPVDLEGAVCEGFFRNAEGANIALTSHSTVEGNEAYITLPQACYNVEGQFCLAIKLIGGGVTSTMRIIDGMVDNTNTGSPVAPTETVPTYQEILAVYAEMQEAVDNYDDVVAAQDAKIDDLKSAFTLVSTKDADNTNSWTVGTLKAADGTTSSSSSRLRTDNFVSLDDNVFGFRTKTGYEFLVYAWDKTSGDYIGCLHEGNVYGTSTSNLLWLNEFYLNAEYKYKIVMRNAVSPSSTITKAEAVNCLYILRAIDKTLSVDGMAADAKATGDEVLKTNEALNASNESISNEFEQIIGNKAFPFKRGRYVAASTSFTGALVSYVDSSTSVCTLIPVTAGDIVYANVYGGTGVNRAYFFCDDEMKCISDGAAGANHHLSGSLTVPSGAYYLALNNTLANMADGYFAYKGESAVKGNTYITGLQKEQFTDYINGKYNASTGNYTSSEDSICFSRFVPLDALFRFTCTSTNTYLFLYDKNGGFIATLGNIGRRYDYSQVDSLRVTYPNAYYFKLKIGDSGKPVTMDTIANFNVSTIIIAERLKQDGYITLKDITPNGTNGTYTASFDVFVPFIGEYRNQIFTCVAKYECGEGVTEYPKICIRTGENLNRTCFYELGKEGQFVTKQWRAVRFPGDMTDYTVSFVIPEGCTVYIREFYNTYDNTIDRAEKGLLIHGHRKLPMTPNDTIHAVLMAAKAGKRSFVEIPKRLSDGTWICYHDDSLIYNDTYIRQADGSQLPSTYNGTLWSAISFETANSWDWGISKGAVFAGTKPMTLNEFFMACAKTGMHPVLSLHPFPTAEQFAEIKAIAKKCGVLDKLELKTGFGNDLSVAYGVFGNEIEEYVYDMPSGERNAQSITNAINALNAFTGCTAKRGIELFASSAYLAYFGSNQFDPFGMIAQAGFICSLAHQNGAYSPTRPGGSTSIMYGKDYDWWAENHGVTEFTDDYNYSDGLNW